MKKAAILLLCLIALLSTAFASGCSKAKAEDVRVLADVLCCFDEGGIDVERIEKMTIPVIGEEILYVYKIHVTIHTDGGDVQDVLGVSYDSVYNTDMMARYDSEKETTINGEPPYGTAFVIWRMTEENPENIEISEIPEKDIPKLVSKAWAYIEENNIHPEEEN